MPATPVSVLRAAGGSPVARWHLRSFGTFPQNSLHYTIGPLIALIVVLGLGYVSRWAFAPSPEQRRRRARAHSRGDYGLLVPVRSVAERAEAEALAGQLRGSGLRVTLSSDPPGPVRVTASGRVITPPRPQTHVLVFAGDVRRAEQVLTRH